MSDLSCRVTWKRGGESAVDKFDLDAATTFDAFIWFIATWVVRNVQCNEL
jgi:hypothetical protein